ncbi:uncharacterized protein LOC126880256 [Diabrotica virgifera virgifera]|uniref:Helitron helicase-like domain-containing protein n=1 Tax=Diabrotica virgifera virgifera TaxID=50390 RepID=A0ABM5JPW4_DIAVI|nr:uncharacterized protein LOC126880256 [Diabrotica virgifera virgifera]
MQTDRRQNKRIREQKRQNDLEAKSIKRENDIVRYREYYNNNLKLENSTIAHEKLKFIESLKNMPCFNCTCCENLFFEHTVLKFDENKVFCVPNYENVIINDITTPYMCRTCYKYVLKGQVPKLSTANGLKFVDIPTSLKTLSSLEERIVSPIVCFLQIRPLKYYAINPQVGLKDSVVNILVEITDMVQVVLPHKINETMTVQVKLKRHVDHKTDYMFETIRPAAICDALKYLIKTPLYIKHDIKVDEKYFEQYENDYSKTIDFVIHRDVHEDEKNDSASEDDDHSDIENDILDTEINDEVLLIDENIVQNDNIKIIAPGQGKVPMPWHLVQDIDELCFPKIFGGFPFNGNNISYSDRIKSEIRRKDRRSCTAHRILFTTSKKTELAISAIIEKVLRKTLNNQNITVTNALNPEYIKSLFKINEGYPFLRPIRASPAYWELKKKDLLALIRQLGRPTLFLTLSAIETIWIELLQCLSKLVDSKTLSVYETANLSTNEKTRFIKEDPVTCARYFDYKIAKMMLYLKSKNSIFKNHPIEDSYQRVEFQMRGSPHEHILLWLKNPPKYDPNNSESIDECIKFIDEYITCKYRENDPYIKLQFHNHPHTCYKKRAKKYADLIFQNP